MPSIHPYYPTQTEVDQWCEELYQSAIKAPYSFEILDRNGYTPALGHFNSDNRYIKFSFEDNTEFYAYWQPTFVKNAPLLVHTTGYGAEFSFHPELVAQGFNVLHVQCMGYATPDGRVESLRNEHNEWPVLPDTITMNAKGGYYNWLSQVVIAVNWALEHFKLDNRISFFGTSQGGGGSLLLTSIFKDKGVQACAADVPFLTHFPMANWRGAYEVAKQAFTADEPTEQQWKAIGYIDTMSHAHRLTVPVLLTAGEIDTTCPPETIEALFDKLPGTKSYTRLQGIGHRYTREFVILTAAWFRLHS